MDKAMDQRTSVVEVLGAVFALCSFAGLAALLRSGRKVTTKAVLSAMLNSGLLGLAIGAIWWHKYGVTQDGVFFLIGVSLLAGLGGTTMVDFCVQILRQAIAASRNHK